MNLALVQMKSLFLRVAVAGIVLSFVPIMAFHTRVLTCVNIGGGIFSFVDASLPCFGFMPKAYTSATPALSGEVHIDTPDVSTEFSSAAIAFAVLQYVVVISLVGLILPAPALLYGLSRRRAKGGAKRTGGIISSATNRRGAGQERNMQRKGEHGGGGERETEGDADNSEKARLVYSSEDKVSDRVYDWVEATQKEQRLGVRDALTRGRVTSIDEDNDGENEEGKRERGLSVPVSANHYYALTYTEGEKRKGGGRAGRRKTVAVDEGGAQPARDWMDAQSAVALTRSNEGVEEGRSGGSGKARRPHSAPMRGRRASLLELGTTKVPFGKNPFWDVATLLVRGDCVWYELFLAYRNFFLLFLNMMVGSGGHFVRSLFICCTLALSLFMHMNVRPRKTLALNVLESILTYFNVLLVMLNMRTAIMVDMGVPYYLPIENSSTSSGFDGHVYACSVSSIAVVILAPVVMVITVLVDKKCGKPRKTLAK
uniref:Uncharacterized protein n=1 Tax=Palpitomonas bilix TaxID=652834 RepID=A0A7S3LV22_9EUKA